MSGFDWAKLTAAWSAGIVVVVAATGASGLALLGLVVAAFIVAVPAFLSGHRRIPPVRPTVDPPSPRLGSQPGGVGGEPIAKVALTSVSTEQLCRAWRYSSATLHRNTTVTERTTAAATRAEYLNELERRDPDGFAAWLATGPRPGGDPARYITKEPARASQRIKSHLHRLRSGQT